MSEPARMSFTVNGRLVEVERHPLTRLLDVLRLDLHLTGSKEGCGEGECGACGVMMNGRLVNSCLVPIVQAQDATITTIEGLATEAELHAVQQAFIDHGGAQCGICTPGMVIAAVDLIERKPEATVAEIREGLAGNLCRCTGYVRILESVVAAMRRPRGAAPQAQE